MALLWKVESLNRTGRAVSSDTSDPTMVDDKDSMTQIDQSRYILFTCFPSKVPTPATVEDGIPDSMDRCSDPV